MFEIIVNPTLDCNLRCWYCYEDHLQGTNMRLELIDSIKALVDRKVESSELKHLSVTFFGGEPLLRWKDVVMPLLQYTVQRCKEKNIGFNTGFTTNGYLLDHRMFDDLISIGLGETSFQISFDGNRELHDKSRVYDAMHPTFDTMLEAVKLGASLGFRMCARFNYTPESLESFTEVLEMMSQWDEITRRNITINLQQVWQTSSGIASNIKGRAADMRTLIQKFGMNPECDMVYFRHVCYADRKNSVVVNYNGDIYKCTARKFEPSLREGVLHSDGTIEYNDRYFKRMDAKFANTACMKCPIMPICNGRCSQHKIDRADFDKCLLDMDFERRMRYMLGSLIYRQTGNALSDNELRKIKMTRHFFPQQ